MNIVALVHLIAGILAMAASVPLIGRKIPMNAIYGFRIDEAFKSEQHWYAINAYGGRLLLQWGILVAGAGLLGTILPQPYWLLYAYGSLAVFLAGMILVIVKVQRYARKEAIPARD